MKGTTLIDETYAQRLWRLFKRDRFAFTGFCIVVVFFVIAALAPFLANDHAIVRVADGRVSFPLFRSLAPIEWRFLIYVPLAGLVYLGRKWLLRAPRKDLALAVLLFWIGAIVAMMLPGRIAFQEVIHHHHFYFAMNLRFIWQLLFLSGFIFVIVRSPRDFGRLPRLNFTFVILTVLLVETVLFFSHPFNDVTNDRTRPAAFKLMAPIPYSPIETSPDQLVPPSWKHPCGTDSTGRDVASRLLHGARTSLAIGFVSQSIALLVGVSLGGLAGYYRRWVDIVTCRFIEVMECFPTLLLILVVVSLSDSANNMMIIMVVIGLTGWTGVARLVRGEFLRLGGQPFPQAAQALGASDLRIIVRHLLPNSLGPILVTATFGVASAILIESSLSFLGFGMQAPTPSWGDLLSEARRYIDFAWWLAFFPGLAILVTIMSYNFVGEGLRDAVDPRLRVK
jgi:peptide/nickel transport system permease protein